eukprot:1311183-Pleurochrysis_carterae.AAC.2
MPQTAMLRGLPAPRCPTELPLLTVFAPQRARAHEQRAGVGASVEAARPGARFAKVLSSTALRLWHVFLPMACARRPVHLNCHGIVA